MHFFIDWQLFPQALCVCAHMFFSFLKRARMSIQNQNTGVAEG